MLIQFPQNVKSVILFKYLAKIEPTPPDVEPTYAMFQKQNLTVKLSRLTDSADAIL